MNQIQRTFNFGANEIRTIDVAKILGYSNTTLAINSHCKGGREMLLPPVETH